MTRQLFVFLLLSVLGGCPTGSLVAGEMAALPYRRISDVFDRFAELKDKDKLALMVRVVPAKKMVPAPVIALVIETRAGPIPLQFGAQGDLLEFPVSPALKKENPRVVSNQPKGTLTLQAGLGIKFSGKLTEDAQWYLEAMRQATAALKAEAGLLSFAVPRLNALVFHFTPGKGDTLSFRIVDNSGRVLPESGGAIRVETITLQEFKDAKLILSSVPQSITLE